LMSCFLPNQATHTSLETVDRRRYLDPPSKQIGQSWEDYHEEYAEESCGGEKERLGLVMVDLCERFHGRRDFVGSSLPSRHNSHIVVLDRLASRIFSSDKCSLSSCSSRLIAIVAPAMPVPEILARSSPDRGETFF